MGITVSEDDALELEQQMLGLTECLREIQDILGRAGATDRAAEWLDRIVDSVYGDGGEPRTIEQGLDGAVFELKLAAGCADE
jgi:hypothetical protein